MFDLKKAVKKIKIWDGTDYVAVENERLKVQQVPKDDNEIRREVTNISLLKEILTELKKMNLYLSIMNDEEIGGEDL